MLSDVPSAIRSHSRFSAWKRSRRPSTLSTTPTEPAGTTRAGGVAPGSFLGLPELSAVFDDAASEPVVASGSASFTAPVASLESPAAAVPAMAPAAAGCEFPAGRFVAPGSAEPSAPGAAPAGGC